MATVQNARDVFLQAAAVRYIVAALPPGISVPVGSVTGLGALAIQNTVAPGQLDAATVSIAQFTSGLTAIEIVAVLPVSGNYDGRTVVLTTNGKLYRYSSGAFTTVVPTTDLTGQITTTQITNNAITTPLINAGAVVTSKIATGAITANEMAANSVIAGKIAAGAIDAFTITGATIRTASSGARIELSSGTLKSTNSGGSNLIEFDDTGKATFTGGVYDPFGGSTYAAVVGRVGTATNPSAVVGVLGTNEKTSGGQAIKGHSVSTNSSGSGVYGLADHSSSIAILGINNAGGTALSLFGAMSISVSTLVTNLNADKLDGYTSAEFCSLFVTDSGTATVAGQGVNITSTVAGTEFVGSSNNVTLQSVSDKRLKQNIVPESLGLKFINSLLPVTFELRRRPGFRYHGFIADDVEPLIDHMNDSLKMENDKGIKGVDYMSLLAPMVRSIQQLSEEVDKLKGGRP